MKSDSSNLKMCFVTAQHGGNAFDLGCYFVKWYIQGSMITKKKSLHIGPLPENTTLELCCQIKAVSMTSEIMLQSARGDCEWEQSPGSLHLVKPIQSDFLCDKENLMEAGSFPFNNVLATHSALCFLTITCIWDEKYRLTLCTSLSSSFCLPSRGL